MIEVMNVEQAIKEAVSKALKLGFDLDVKDIEVQVPVSLEHGDYSTNIAMQLAKELKDSPPNIAHKIDEYLDGDESLKEYVSNIEVVAPGFINFTLNQEYLSTVLNEALKDEFGRNDVLKGKRVILEYTDPNPFKILHVGHLFTNMIGESLARLYEASGAEVKRANYQGDLGLHVAKSLWGLEKLLEQKGMTFDELAKKDLVERVNFLGEAYLFGAAEYKKEDPATVEDINNINYIPFNLVDSEVFPDIKDSVKGRDLERMYKEGRDWCLEYFERIYKRMGTKFDYYFFESEVSREGYKIVLDAVEKGIFIKDDGAIIFRGEEYDPSLHTRVFVNKHGLPTYDAKDLALPILKNEKFDYDESIIITGSEQGPYFKVVLKALEQLNSELSSATKHIGHGLILAGDGKKMASRSGGAASAEWLLDETKKRVMEKMGEKADEEIADRIAVGSVKYAFLKVALGKNVTFDFDESTNFDGDTGAYAMYAYARAQSILKNAGVDPASVSKKIFEGVELELVRTIEKYPRMVQMATKALSSNILIDYLFDLAKLFSRFYQEVNVSNSEGEELEARAGIVKAVGKIVKNSLYLIGIEVVEKM
jgi:arginyl-tRNA synthetase